MSNHIIEKLTQAVALLHEARAEVEGLQGCLNHLEEAAGDIAAELDDLEYSLPDVDDYEPHCTQEGLMDLESILEGMNAEKVEEIEGVVESAISDMADELRSAFEDALGDIQYRLPNVSSDASDLSNAASDADHEVMSLDSNIQGAAEVLQSLLKEVESGGVAAAELAAAHARITELEELTQSLRDQLSQERARYRRMAYA